MADNVTRGRRGKLQMTGESATEGFTGLSKDLELKIIGMDGGEFLIKALQEACKKGSKIPKMFSPASLEKMDDGELAVLCSSARGRADLKQGDVEMRDLIRQDIGGSFDARGEQTWTEHVQGVTAGVTVESDAITKKIEDFIKALEMFEVRVADKGSIISDSFADSVENDIKDLKKNWGIDLFQFVPDLPKRVEVLKHKGGINTVKAYLAHCRIQKGLSDLGSLSEWYNATQEAIKRNKQYISAEELLPVQAELDKIFDFLSRTAPGTSI